MAKGKKKDKRPARSRYGLENHERQNKDRNATRELILQDWYARRNSLMKAYGLNKTQAKKLSYLVEAGEDAAEAVKKVNTATTRS